MAIYDIDQKKQLDFFEMDAQHSSSDEKVGRGDNNRGRIFSSIFARLFFFLLLLADLLWLGYNLLCLAVSTLGWLLSFGRVSFFEKILFSVWLSLKRSLVCGLSLVVALFCPAFGILIACTYFLMYDKEGIEEVVPSSLQEQFKEFMPNANV